MDEINQIKKEVADIKREMMNLKNSSTIPYDIERAFKTRGFVKTDFFVAGYSAFSAAGESFIDIPGATQNSIPFAITKTNSVGTVLGAKIITNATAISLGWPTNPVGYTLYVQGTANDEFYFIVFLFNQLFLAE